MDMKRKPQKGKTLWGLTTNPQGNIFTKQNEIFTLSNNTC